MTSSFLRAEKIVNDTNIVSGTREYLFNDYNAERCDIAYINIFIIININVHIVMLKKKEKKKIRRRVHILLYM